VLRFGLRSPHLVAAPRSIAVKTMRARRLVCIRPTLRLPGGQTAPARATGDSDKPDATATPVLQILYGNIYYLYLFTG